MINMKYSREGAKAPPQINSKSNFEMYTLYNQKLSKTKYKRWGMLDIDPYSENQSFKNSRAEKVRINDSSHSYYRPAEYRSSNNRSGTSDYRFDQTKHSILPSTAKTDNITSIELVNETLPNLIIKSSEFDQNPNYLPGLKNGKKKCKIVILICLACSHKIKMKT